MNKNFQVCHRVAKNQNLVTVNVVSYLAIVFCIYYNVSYLFEFYL